MDIKLEKTGLKAGLEIHQQLNTHKLFCSCPSLLRSDSPSFIVQRKLNPVVGETGEIDIAALYEKQKDKTFTYHVFDTNCLVELDEEPPHKINQEALKITLQIALLLNCKIFPVTQIMRKTVIDGSNTSGFQRTVLIAHDGYIKTSHGDVRIETIALEEDSARKISDEYNNRAYSLDRLGIPLVEITTKPDLKTPDQIKEAALKIGEILRACQVKRGIGTIRQDVNISIKGGNRVEIKGFQDPRIMIDTINNEIQRQIKLTVLKEKFKQTKISQLFELNHIFSKTECNLIKKSITSNKFIYGFSLSNLKGIIGEEIQKNKRIGTDLYEFSRQLSGIGGIIHSDENLSKYEFSEKELTQIKETLNIKEKDAFILIIGEERQVEKAQNAIKTRIKQLSLGVPKEVRQSNIDATTSFLRPMPGKDRMYPETDCELLRLKKQEIEDLKKTLPKLASENKKYLSQFGLNEELISLLLKQRKEEEFKELTNITDHYDLIAKSLTIFPKEISKKENLTLEKINHILNQDTLVSILSMVGGEISPNDVKQILHKIVQGKNLKEALEKKEVHLSEEIKILIKEKPSLTHGAYMGLIMNKFKGHVTGKEVSDELKKQLKTS
jgi:glutamyl-tRNA(Gln) amidotransferase subunit E